MDKVDFKKTLPSYRARHTFFDTIEVPALAYLMIDGHGDPNSSPDFTSAIETLFPLGCALKFFSKDVLGRDYAAAVAKGRRPLPRLGDIRFDTLEEGTSGQTLHIGPFDAEAAVLEYMHTEVIEAAGLEMAGWHHEIYLSDLRRTAPEKLRTDSASTGAEVGHSRT